MTKKNLLPIKITQECPSESFSLKLENTVIESPINIITGANGYGKTRLLSEINTNNKILLQCPSCFATSTLIDIFNITNNQASTNNIITKDRAKTLFKDYDEVIRKCLPDTYDEFKKYGPNKGCDAITFNYVLSKNINGEIGIEIETIKTIAEKYKVDINKLTKKHFFSFYSALQDIKIDINSNIKAVLTTYFHLKIKDKLLDFKRNILSPWSFINHNIFEKILKSDIRLVEWDIEIFLNAILNSTDFNNDIEIYFYKKSSPEKKFNSDGLSRGEKCILWIATQCFYTNFLEDNYELTEVILLDEPDVFLHPQMIDAFFKVLLEIHNELGTIFFLTTHSPTTVALAPKEKNSIFLIEPYNENNFTHKLSTTTIDQAIGNLLFGVPHIAVEEKNHRKVYVESLYDEYIYNKIFKKIFSSENKILVRKDVSLEFIATSTFKNSPLENIKAALNSANINFDDEQLKKIGHHLNGMGNCEKVIAQVEELLKKGEHRTFGIIDWDLKNKKSKFNSIYVIAENDFYSIENIVLNPVILVFWQLHKNKLLPLKNHHTRTINLETKILTNNIKDFISKKSNSDILSNENIYIKAKKTIDEFSSNKNIQFMNNKKYNIPRWWGRIKGHDLEEILYAYFNDKKYIENNNFMKSIISLLILNEGVKYFPMCIADTFKSIQDNEQ
ncbi:MAG: AAA family ATPase [Pseudomonadota bacterium]